MELYLFFYKGHTLCSIIKIHQTVLCSFYKVPPLNISLEQSDRVEVLRLSSGCRHQRDGRRHGPDGTGWPRAQGPQLESRQGDDGQGGHFPGLTHQLQQGEHPRELPQGYPALPAGPRVPAGAGGRQVVRSRRPLLVGHQHCAVLPSVLRGGAQEAGSEQGQR